LNCNFTQVDSVRVQLFSRWGQLTDHLAVWGFDGLGKALLNERKRRTCYKQGALKRKDSHGDRQD